LLINSPDNLDAYRRMIEAIRSDETVAFAGAGVSIPLGYPNWSGLLNRLAEETKKTRGENITDSLGTKMTVAGVTAMPNTLIRAEIFKFNLGKRYRELLCEIFAPKHGMAADIANISRVPFQHILTSNYDVAIEIAHDELQIEYESFSLADGPAETFVGKIGDYRCQRCIVHVHGRYDDPDSIVLTNSEYGHIYEGSPVCRSLWNTLPISRRCVFFGFSFLDEDIAEKFSLRIFQRTHRCISGIRHFAVVALEERNAEGPIRSSFRQQYGIEPVFFQPLDSNFSGYSVLIGDIVSRTVNAANEAPAAASKRISEKWPQEPRAKSVWITGAIDAGKDLASSSKDVARLKALTQMNMRKTKTGDLK
jgi:hypothetical protein